MMQPSPWSSGPLAVLNTHAGLLQCCVLDGVLKPSAGLWWLGLPRCAQGAATPLPAMPASSPSCHAVWLLWGSPATMLEPSMLVLWAPGHVWR